MNFLDKVTAAVTIGFVATGEPIERGAPFTDAGMVEGFHLPGVLVF